KRRSCIGKWPEIDAISDQRNLLLGDSGLKQPGLYFIGNSYNLRVTSQHKAIHNAIQGDEQASLEPVVAGRNKWGRRSTQREIDIDIRLVTMRMHDIRSSLGYKAPDTHSYGTIDLSAAWDQMRLNSLSHSSIVELQVRIRGVGKDTQGAGMRAFI